MLLVNVKEIKKPDLDAQLVAESIAMQLEKRVAAKRALKQAIERVMNMTLRDIPASWGNHSEYRLLENNSNNWFKVKAESITKWLDK